MRRLYQRIAKLHLAKDAAHDKCMGEKCSHAPEIECIWADGRGRAWHCQKCHDKWVKENEKSEETEGWLPLAIVKQRKIPNGVVGKNYGEYPKTASEVSSTDMRDAYQVLGDALFNVPQLSRYKHPKFSEFLQHRDVVVIPLSAVITFADYGRRPTGKRLRKPIVVAQEPGRRKFWALDGQHRVHALRETGETHVEAIVVPLEIRRRPGETASQRTAKAEGKKKWGGESVGLFIPLPKRLAKKFPSLGEEDTSPSHVTFLYIGDVKDQAAQEKVLQVIQDVHGKWWPEVTATLGNLAYFNQPDKDRRVAHVQVDFDKDLSGMRHRVKQALTDAGIEVQDSFVEYRPHVTLAYMPGIDHPDYDGEVPQGNWKFRGLEVWGLPEVVKIKFGPSFYKVSERWLLSKIKQASTHKRSIALMRWLSEATRKLGVSRETYVVGGAVRNFVLDVPIKDIDIVLDSVAAGKDSDWLAGQLARMIPVPTDIMTNQYGVAILSVKGNWMLDGEDMQGEVIEIANARKESYTEQTGKGYKPHMVEPATIEEDVLRREFSFNTLLWRLLDLAHGPEKAEIIDLTGCGLKDLEEMTLRCPRDPDVVFSDDPTRMLRAIKFVSKYGFKIPSDVAASIRQNARKLKKMPWEAVGKILISDILDQPTARKSLVQMKQLGLLDVISEMIQEQKPFGAYMSNQLRTDRRVQFLLDMLEMGVPAGTPISFLDRAGQQRLRELTVVMPADEASRFVDILIKPPVNNMRVITLLSLGRLARGRILLLARALLLAQPELAYDPHRLTEEVIRQW